MSGNMQYVTPMKNHRCDCRLMPNEKFDSIQSQNEFKKYGTFHSRKNLEPLQHRDQSHFINHKCHELSREHMSTSLNYRRGSEEYHSSIQNHPTVTTRRNSISEPQLVEHFNTGNRYFEGYLPSARGSLSTEMESSYTSSPRTPDPDTRRTFEFPNTPKRTRSSSFSARRRSLNNLEVKFHDAIENSSADFLNSPRLLRSPTCSTSRKTRTFNDLAVKLDDVIEGSNSSIIQDSSRSYESSSFSSSSRRRNLNHSNAMFINANEEPAFRKWNQKATEKHIGNSPAKELRSRRRRLDSLHLDPPRLSSCSLPQEDHDVFHFRDIFHIREIFHLRERLSALEWRTYLPTSYLPAIPQMQFYGGEPIGVSDSDNHELLDDTIIEGQELYLHFFHEQLRKAGLEKEFAAQEEEGLSSYHALNTHVEGSDTEITELTNEGRSRKMSFNLENFQNPLWRKTGRDLKLLADQFANSVERLRVQERAEQINIESLNKAKFFSMMNELFQGGKVTRERILVLFFFCSDVAIRAIKNNSEGWLSTLTQWSLIFIKEQVCAWVGNNGGWQTVLRSGFNMLQQTIFIGACAAVIVCSAIYIRKNLV